MLPVIQIGPLTIPTNAFIIIIGLWLGLSLAEKHSSKRSIDANILYSLVFAILVTGIVAARLVYIARYPSSFLEDPISIVLPNPNMLDLPGALAGSILGGLIFASRKKLDFDQMMDALTPLLAIMVISTSLANLATGKGYGAPADLPWAISLWGMRRHPTQVYEVLAAGLSLFTLWPGRPWLSLLRPGGLFWAFLALSSFNRLILEAFRGDSIIIFENYRGMQILALAVLLLSLWVLRKKLPNIQSTDRNENITVI